MHEDRRRLLTLWLLVPLALCAVEIINSFEEGVAYYTPRRATVFTFLVVAFWIIATVAAKYSKLGILWRDAKGEVVRIRKLGTLTHRGFVVVIAMIWAWIPLSYLLGPSSEGTGSLPEKPRAEPESVNSTVALPVESTISVPPGKTVLHFQIIALGSCRIVEAHMVQPEGSHDLQDYKYDYSQARDWQYNIPDGTSRQPRTINVKVTVRLKADPDTPPPGLSCLRTVHWY